jgi:hypothetical protein
MDTLLYILEIILKLIIGLGIINVWLLRFNNTSEWRGANADNMKEEFAAYGLPIAAMYVVGFLKSVFAIMILISIFYNPIGEPAAYGIAILMVGAIGMHIKIGDEPKKSLPAFILMLLSIIVTLFY